MLGDFHNGDTPGHGDLSFYGFIAGYLYANSPIIHNMIEQAELESWVVKMKQVVPLDSLF